MPKNNLQSEPVVQVEQPVVEPVKPVVKPNVVELNPLHIVQPVEVLQTVRAHAKPWEEPKPVEPEVVVEEEGPAVNVKLVKRQGRWFVAALIAAVVIVVLAILNPIPAVVNFAATLKNLSLSVGNSMVDGSYAVVIGVYALFAIILSIVIRFFACAKKKPTCAGCEFVKFCWTTTFVTIIGFVLLSVLGVQWFATAGTSLLEVLMGTSEAPKAYQTVALVLFGFCLALLAFVVIVTIAHKASHKKHK